MEPGIQKISHSGQAVIEYLLMIIVALSVAGALGYGFRRVLFKVWMQMACEITAPCPSCSTLPEIKRVANQFVPGTCK